MLVSGGTRAGAGFSPEPNEFWCDTYIQLKQALVSGVKPLSITLDKHVSGDMMYQLGCYEMLEDILYCDRAYSYTLIPTDMEIYYLFEPTPEFKWSLDQLILAHKNDRDLHNRTTSSARHRDG